MTMPLFLLLIMTIALRSGVRDVCKLRGFIDVFQHEHLFIEWADVQHGVHRYICVYITHYVPIPCFIFLAAHGAG